MVNNVFLIRLLYIIIWEASYPFGRPDPQWGGSVSVNLSYVARKRYNFGIELKSQNPHRLITMIERGDWGGLTLIIRLISVFNWTELELDLN